MASQKAITRSGARGGWVARAIAGLLLGTLLFPVGAVGMIGSMHNRGSFLHAFVFFVLCLTGAAAIGSIPRCIKHYRYPSLLIMDDTGVQVVDASQTRRWAWSDIAGATTGRGTVFVSLLVRRTSQSKSYVDIGPWPKGTLEEILQQKAAR